MSLIGKIALVTGSTSGIGLGIARQLAKQDCMVILTGLAEPKLIDTLTQEFNRCNKRPRFLSSDLRTKRLTKKLCQEVSALHPEGVDILVNNAGIQHVCKIENYPDDNWDDMMSITVSAPFHLIKHFIPNMKQKGWGRIVNVSSMMGIISQEGKAPYSASKSAVLGLTKGIALEAAPFGVMCNAVCPAYVNTPLIKEQIETLRQEKGLTFEEAEKSFFSKHPTGKPIEISEVAEMVGFLCSSAADNITGTSIMMDAGFTIR